MFDFIANLLSVVLTLLFPIYASHKALGTADPNLLTPWLTYFLVLTLASAAEALLAPVLAFVPFYAWLRLLLHLYLLLPGPQQGAGFLYATHVQPFLTQHEADIERAISDAHDQAKAAGLDYLKRALEWLKATALGQPQPRAAAAAAPPPPPPQQSYAQTLLGRFSLPAAHAPAGDVYALLRDALQAATAGAGVGAASPAASGEPLVPPSLRDPGERASYIASQRERLQTLLHAFDREASALGASATEAAPADEAESGTKTPGADFEKIAHEDIRSGKEVVVPGWGVWIWGSGKSGEKRAAAVQDQAAAGKSTAIDVK